MNLRHNQINQCGTSVRRLTAYYRRRKLASSASGSTYHCRPELCLELCQFLSVRRGNSGVRWQLRQIHWTTSARRSCANAFVLRGRR
jgi:hypothetical protein